MNFKRCGGRKMKYSLHGWDDEKIYFWDGRKERSVTDEKELYDQLLEICVEYFGREKKNKERDK